MRSPRLKAGISKLTIYHGIGGIRVGIRTEDIAGTEIDHGGAGGSADCLAIVVHRSTPIRTA